MLPSPPTVANQADSADAEQALAPVLRIIRQLASPPAVAKRADIADAEQNETGRFRVEAASTTDVFPEKPSAPGVDEDAVKEMVRTFSSVYRVT
jgi:hypothetical protein